MFIDTSAIIALLAGEPEAGDFAGRISGAPSRATSGLVILEASMRLSTMLDLDPLLIERRVRVLIDEAEIEILPIDGTIATASVRAFAAYGKGRGHPAQLNLADCMSYACAKVHGMPLLFKGNDFSRTDIAAA
ncbi:type II toxin-antitoxin system VapC family toxin [Pararhizobium qamdonense]|uniref:type II toxin-antitoxin system VapC family toxin n=1 Tax=Pararhizobium qamdonense TaxID=3031126 RepID=UPI0023E0B866|nr:type II toxin-antitoxin system VapC family toxin [Pararhizobium qamdonense]